MAIEISTASLPSRSMGAHPVWLSKNSQDGCSMNALSRFLATLCAVMATSLTTHAFAQQADAPKLPTRIAPHLFRVDDFLHLPRALVVPEGQAPEYSLNNLAAWGCDGVTNPGALATCGKYLISQKRIALKRPAVLKEKAGDIYGYTRYAVETVDGQHLDIWTTEFGCNFSPDGSKLRWRDVIEDRLEDLRSPWSPEPYNNIIYNNMLHPGQMPYLQRVASDGRVLWAYVYLVRTIGYAFDKGDYPVVENPLLGFGEVVCPKGSGPTGFLTSTVTRNGEFKFGAMAIAIDTFTGQPKAKHPRIRVVPAAEIEQHYRHALAELIEEGVIREKDTQITTEPFRGVTPPSRFLSNSNKLSERIERNLLNAYFINKTQGVKK
jgi:hypothetical protein